MEAFPHSNRGSRGRSDERVLVANKSAAWATRTKRLRRQIVDSVHRRPDVIRGRAREDRGVPRPSLGGNGCLWVVGRWSEAADGLIWPVC